MHQNLVLISLYLYRTQKSEEDEEKKKKKNHATMKSGLTDVTNTFERKERGRGRDKNVSAVELQVHVKISTHKNEPLKRLNCVHAKCSKMSCGMISDTKMIQNAAIDHLSFCE